MASPHTQHKLCQGPGSTVSIYVCAVAVKKSLRTSKLDMEETTAKPATVDLYLEESAYQWHLHIPSTNYVKDQESEVGKLKLLSKASR